LVFSQMYKVTAIHQRSQILTVATQIVP